MPAKEAALTDSAHSSAIPPNTPAWDFCDRILVQVSRSFAIIIPQCPPPIDRALCAAYLLCRVADTIEDEPALDERRRSRLYDAFLGCVDHPTDSVMAARFLEDWPPDMPFSDSAYRELVLGTPQVLAAYASLPEALRTPIRRCVDEMVAGMRSVRPRELSAGVAFFCRNLADLDAYCHIVAGTVGVMSTALFEWYMEGANFHADPGWREQGRRLGLGLQMTNIIKDCRVDADRGVSYIPPQYVRQTEGRYQLDPTAKPALFAHAIDHLDAGLDYTLALPRDQAGIRRFLLGSLLPAIATLKAATESMEHHPKIKREEMMEILEMIAGESIEEGPVRRWYQAHREETRRMCSEIPAGE